MKKLVFIFTLLFTLKNIARGSFINFGLSSSYFFTYDLLRTKETLIKKLVPNIDLIKININTRIMNINQNLKLYLDFSLAGFSWRSFSTTIKQIDTAMEWKEDLFQDNKFLRTIYIEGAYQNDTNIYVTSVNPGGKRDQYNINYINEEGKFSTLENITIANLYNNNNGGKSRFIIWPYSLGSFIIPISGGISTKIKIHSKTYIRIGLQGYVNINLKYLCEMKIHDFIYGYATEEDVQKEKKNDNSIFAFNLFDEKENIKRMSLNMKSSSYDKLSAKLEFDVQFLECEMQCYYGVIFDISINSRIYKYLEIIFSVMSLEYCYVPDSTKLQDQQKAYLKRLPPFNGRNHALIFHAPHFKISLVY